jgi:hypothetical protein
MVNRKILKVLVMSMLFTTACGGTMSLAANAVSSNGDLIASSITGSQTFNTVTVTSNTDATVRQGDKSYTVTNSNQNGWNSIIGAECNGSNDYQASYVAGNEVDIQASKDETIAVRRLVGGDNGTSPGGAGGGHFNSLMNNVINIGTSTEGGTLKADEIIGGLSGEIYYPKILPYDNVINFNNMTVEGLDDTQRVKIYGGKIGTDTAIANWQNTPSNVINIQNQAVLKNADIYGGFTHVDQWGGHVKDAEINLSGQADLINTNLYGADIREHGNNTSSTLNIGYAENYSLNPNGRFPNGNTLNADYWPGSKGTCLTLTPRSEAWSYSKNTSIQNVGEFTNVKVWTMVDENTPAIQINGTGNFIYHTSDGYSEKGTVIDVTALTNGEGKSIFFTDLKPDDQRTIIKANNGIYEKNDVKAELKSQPLNYDYKLTQGDNSLRGTYHGDAAISRNDVIWKTGDITASDLDVSHMTLDASGQQTSPLTLEKYGYIFNENTKLSTDDIRVTNEGSALIAPSDSWTLVDGSQAASLSGLDNLTRKEIPVSYDMKQGAVTVTGLGQTTASADQKKLNYNIAHTKSLTYHTLDWGNTQPVVSLDSSKNYDLKDTQIDWSSLQHRGLANLRGGMNERILLDANGKDSGLTDQNLTGTPQHLVSGTTLEGTGQAAVKDGNVVYTADMHAQPQTHSVLMGGEAGLAALLESNDLVLDTMKNLDKSKDYANTFATIGGGENRYETGSHITTNIWRSQTGFAIKNKNKAGAQTEYGIFYDYGNGNYRTFFNNRGDGKINYKGGGFFGKRLEPKGGYEEASFRLGRASNDARNLLYDEDGRGYSYRTNSMYNAFHIGFGQISPQSDGGTLDTYFRFFHTHLNGDTFDAGGHYDIDSLNSDIIRIGSRWQKQDKNWEYYAGLAYEYEFGGQAHGLADGADIEGASIRGGSVRFEYGANVDLDKWRIAMNASDYAGKRKGFNGNISVSYKL